MHQRRIEKKAAPAQTTGRTSHNPNAPRTAVPPPFDLDGDKETRAAIATLTGMIERLTERVERLQETQASHLDQSGAGHTHDRFRRLLNGNPSGVFNLLSSAITVVPTVCALALGLFRYLPLPTGSMPAWTLWDLVRPLLPMAGAVAVVSLLILASRWLRRKSVRLRFLTTVMTCYGAATVLYLAWLSLAFLRFNTLPGGVLLTLTWVGIASIVRRALGEWREIREMMRVQLEKEESSRKLVRRGE